ncbi:host specificity protein J [Serratia marcescens]|uniref:host specificity protein J n=1 Tax=Serratia marcescens TaxID=615 RepID=UPI00198117F6|nr:host specificity protein J [Serratia marcescens]MBN3902115.1 host specificity protein J [Serratia marcescens]MBN3913624.1 host specificity protein J [Serratia marcescens]MBN3918103.1 host specificity protein J [Serratia marcescens]MBN3934803.1 host specificity protein J [Serratia marcescens]MBN3955020.1 host specificity protein J [Serratia marcescens]
MAQKIIRGRKGGGGGGHTPVESPDSIQSIARAKMLFALGEGEFAGGLDGTNIFADGTPALNADGSENFPGFRWEFRPGTQAQDYIQGIPAVENEITVGTELKSGTPWVRSVSNLQLSAVRLRFGWPMLQKQEDNGDVNGYRIEYAIDVATDGGSYQEMLTAAIDDKTTSLYERSHRVNLPKATTGWQVRVRRLTPNANSARIADRMNIEALTEIIDAKLRYPNTALLYVEFDSKQFPNIPKISCAPRGRVIRVPDNYDPETRSYTGVWTGGFKWAYSDNPAWVFYDIILADRFGLGDRIDSTQVSESELYRIAQYCDQPVPDGRGGDGMEPRFTCNVYIQSREDAWTVLSDLAGIFRGMTYWGQNQMVALADMPRDMDFTYTRANVIDGKFTYSSASERTRYSTAMVSWSDPANHYADAIEAVFDSDLVRRYDVNQTELTAIGCTRQSEANRRGRWALLTNSKDRTVTFSVGLDGMIPMPGHIVGVADQMVAGRVIGGRISAVDGRKLKLDRKPGAKVGDRLIINLPSGKAQARTVQAVNDRVVTVTTAYSEIPVPESAWSIDADDLAVQLYRVVGIADNGDNTFTINATEHDPNKYARIDTGARIDDRPISIIPPGVQAPPKNITIDSYSSVSQGIAITTLRAAWGAVDNAIAYEAEWRKDNGNWVSVPRTSALGFEVPGIYAGRYLVRVRAINASDISSVWASSMETYLKGKEGKPPVPVGFKASPLLWGIQLDWGFPDGAEDTLKTEIQYADNAAGNNAMLLADIPYPLHTHTMTGLKAGQEFWFRARLQDRTGNQGDWTGWIKGQSNANAGDYLESIGDGFLTDKDGDRLTGDIDTNIEAIIQNALANNATVEHQWAQYGTVRADILVVKTTIAEVDHALAELSTQVQAQIDDVTAVLEDKLTATVDAEGATAIHTLKAGVRVNGVFYNAGMSIAVLAETGKPVITRIGFNANQFVLMSGSGDTQYSPFAVVNGQVFISDAFIQNASITSAKIADAAITNAKISGFIQSDNFSATSGWRMDKSGAGAGQIQINGGDGNGRMEIRGDQINVYDAGGNLRVRMGRL